MNNAYGLTPEQDRAVRDIVEQLNLAGMGASYHAIASIVTNSYKREEMINPLTKVKNVKRRLNRK